MITAMNLPAAASSLLGARGSPETLEEWLKAQREQHFMPIL
jgi:hypothetical protein